MKKSDSAILVISSDNYDDLWKPFFIQFFKCWADCSFPVYLGSNTKRYLFHSQVQTILSGKDKNWSTSLKIILNQINESYLLVILEDFFIKTKVENIHIQKHFNFMKNNNIKYLRFNSSIKPDRKINNEYGEVSKGAPYRVNVFGFWEKETLLKLLLDGENPWNFEIMGSYRSSYSDGFLSFLRSPFEIINMVEKGKFFKKSLSFAKLNNLNLDLTKRDVLKNKFQLKSLIQISLFQVINLFPWRFRIKVMNIMRKLLVCY